MIASTREFNAVIVRERASLEGLTVDELLRRQAQAQGAWESGGGWEGARYRLAWAKDYIARHSAVRMMG